MAAENEIPDTNSLIHLEGVPYSLKPPIGFDFNSETIEMWSGDAVGTTGGRTLQGRLIVRFDLQPRPSVRWTFTFDEDMAQSICRSFSDDREWTIDFSTNGPIGSFKGTWLTSGVGELAGIISEAPVKATLDGECRAVFLVINGPLQYGRPIQNDRSSFCGRLTAERNNAAIVIDRLSSETKGVKSRSYSFTHVAEVRSSQGLSELQFSGISRDIFRSLSLMRNGWIGLLGPWIFKGSELAGLVLAVTKCSRYQGGGWCHRSDPDVFAQLFPRLEVLQAGGNVDHSEAWQTAFHWLIESELCAGGMEGALILQQAALEAVAWYAVVTSRKLCSEAGFEKLPADDKLRWLCSVFSIPIAIPSVATELKSISSVFQQEDIIGILTAARNAFVHNNPKKLRRLREIEGKGGLRELWWQVGGILELVVLALIGFDGNTIRRDIDSRRVEECLKRVPWASGPKY